MIGIGYVLIYVKRVKICLQTRAYRPRMQLDEILACAMGFVFHDAWDQSEVLETAGDDIFARGKNACVVRVGTEMMVGWKKES